MGFFKNTYRTLLGGPSFRKFNEHLIQWAYTGLGVGNYESDQISGEAPFLQGYLNPRHYHRASFWMLAPTLDIIQKPCIK
jgi:hypothetical protein